MRWPASRAHLLLGLVLATSTPVWGQEAFQVTLDRDGETIGDMRPVFLQFESKSLPAISPREVARRYVRMFDQTFDPTLRIDALNRLASLQDRAAGDLQIDVETELRLYREAIRDYEQLIATSESDYPRDQLLYQLAKAHALVGEGERSIAQLQRLVREHPRSPLIHEARFRIAERAFALQDYAQAEAGYQQVIKADDATDSLKTKTWYMLGWSQYKQEALDRAGDSFIAVLDQKAAVTDRFRAVPDGELEVVDDTLRILALISARTGGANALAGRLARVGERDYEYLLYDRLADYYASEGRARDSVAAAERFIRNQPAHASVPALRQQVIAVWQQQGFADQARDAKADYIAAYRDQGSYDRLQENEQVLWQRYTRELADYHYQRAGTATATAEEFARSGDLYSLLAPRLTDSGDVQRLAGDAWLQAGDYQRALDEYRNAGYNAPGYNEAADAAWAAVRLMAEGLDRKVALAIDLDGYVAGIQRFHRRFAMDPRGYQAFVDAANRLLTAERDAEALTMAAEVSADPAASPEDRYAAWLAQGRAQQGLSRFDAAERSWREALAMTTQGLLAVVESERQALVEQLATSIYRQAEVALAADQIDVAVAHFQRIDSVAPSSELAIRGRFDAANTLLSSERWQAAINELVRFRGDFPDHTLAAQIHDKLVYAYHASGQPIRAADELMAGASQNKVSWEKQLRAAEFYHQGGADGDRNRIYQAYLATAAPAGDEQEHLLQQRMRQRLITSGAAGDALRQTLVARELESDWHSEASLAAAAEAALVLGRAAGESFADIALVHPLPQSLARKRQALDRALERYQQAVRFGTDAAGSEALYRQAELYRKLAADLMASSRPDGLNKLESMQYDLLLEEQAYPFEEKALALHARNHQRLSEGYFDEWVAQSLDVLSQLHPGRYQRDSRWMAWTNEEGGDA